MSRQIQSGKNVLNAIERAIRAKQDLDNALLDVVQALKVDGQPDYEFKTYLDMHTAVNVVTYPTLLLQRNAWTQFVNFREGDK